MISKKALARLAASFRGGQKPDADIKDAVHPTRWSLAPALQGFLVLSEVHRGDLLVRDLFASKFGGHPPEFGSHMVAFHRRGDGSCVPIGYVHLWTRNGLGYIGGVLTSDRLLKSLSSAERDALRQAGGGVYFHLLSYTFQRFSNELDAYVGYCGDALSLRVSLSAGFEKTRHPHLLFKANRPLSPERVEQLVAEAHAQGAF